MECKRNYPYLVTFCCLKKKSHQAKGTRGNAYDTSIKRNAQRTKLLSNPYLALEMPPSWSHFVLPRERLFQKSNTEPDVLDEQPIVEPLEGFVLASTRPAPDRTPPVLPPPWA